MIIRELTPDEVEKNINPLIPEAFADTFSYSIFDVRTQKEIDEYPRLASNFNKREFIYLGVFDESGNIMGWSISYQARRYELYTQTSVVLPAFRRRGIYSEITKTILNLAKEKGYQMVTSYHVVSNNAVIIAKLKLGFRISGFELSDDYGSLVKMTCFLNEKRARMYDFRAGTLRPDEEMKAIFRL